VVVRAEKSGRNVAQKATAAKADRESGRETSIRSTVFGWPPVIPGLEVRKEGKAWFEAAVLLISREKGEAIG
jgi:hypothetical protein